jgi:hypothetical protein
MSHCTSLLHFDSFDLSMMCAACDKRAEGYRSNVYNIFTNGSKQKRLMTKPLNSVTVINWGITEGPITGIIYFVNVYSLK